ncbi:hypothetical protein HNP25_004397 [Arcicella rosea]|uniref:Uncharacterized protein n=1 Tax=Arcicella rosea TaxID=502909 RepID=A0A841EYL6_9BACT|nr:hypothetical protein [Arcicella rosea]
MFLIKSHISCNITIFLHIVKMNAFMSDILAKSVLQWKVNNLLREDLRASNDDLILKKWLK